MNCCRTDRPVTSFSQRSLLPLPQAFRLTSLVVLALSVGGPPSLLAEELGVRDVRVEVESGEIHIQVEAAGDGEHVLVELEPYQPDAKFAEGRKVADVNEGRGLVVLPRTSEGRDRLDSRFLLVSNNQPVGHARYPTHLEVVSADRTPFPQTTSKKGLQVQMLDDALALGIEHATLNVNLAGLIDLRGRRDSLSWESQGGRFLFHQRALLRLDEQVKTLSDAGVVVYLILLNYVHGDPDVDAIMRHPQSPERPRNNITAFNLVTEEGAAWFRATLQMLANRYAGPDRERGRVAGFIVGNEVNSHSYWHAQGSEEPEVVIEQYHRMLRVAHAAVRRSSATARVYISLDHFWGRGMGSDPREAFGGKLLVDQLAEWSNNSGNFDWHVAHHPYPENLFEPRSWLDQSPRRSADTPRITFKNLEQLTLYLERPELMYDGEPRRVILSEQGFNSPDTPEGQLHQAAGYCYAWIKVQQLEGIDAFVLHRHVDHGHEGGLNLGLWTRKPDSVATPDQPKKIYEVFRLADTEQWEEVFEFALPVIGIRNWDELP